MSLDIDIKNDQFSCLKCFSDRCEGGSIVVAVYLGILKEVPRFDICFKRLFAYKVVLFSVYFASRGGRVVVEIEK